VLTFLVRGWLDELIAPQQTAATKGGKIEKLHSGSGWWFGDEKLVCGRDKQHK
jgi:hypothetical protein